MDKWGNRIKKTKTLKSVPINLAKTTGQSDHKGIVWNGEGKSAGVAPMLIKCQREKTNLRAEQNAILQHMVNHIHIDGFPTFPQEL